MPRSFASTLNPFAPATSKGAKLHGPSSLREDRSSTAHCLFQFSSPMGWRQLFTVSILVNFNHCVIAVAVAFLVPESPSYYIRIYTCIYRPSIIVPRRRAPDSEARRLPRRVSNARLSLLPRTNNQRLAICSKEAWNLPISLEGRWPRR